ncbi:hypothetical protein OG871_01750 [Kitasatospora sp. NBC_00374]|uniref:hypothetical protein n=1 Tax=Kitasatospora sp. NBC_00374 TaxID=2975964 RepID=UPI0030DDE5BD
MELMAGHLNLFLSEESADASQLDILAGRLRYELLQLDVVDVGRLHAAELPVGARGLDAATVGGLVVGLGQSTTALSSVVSTIRQWLTRSRGVARAVRIEIDGDALELAEATVADSDRLVDLFVSRHTMEAGHGRKTPGPDHR